MRRLVAPAQTHALRVLACVLVSLTLHAAPRSAVMTAESQGSVAQPMRIGLTFSQREATYRALPWQEAYDNVLEFSPALVRIAAYWNEIEPTAGTYDFTTLDWLLSKATERKQTVLFSVGMKAPRWPEYYLPAWLRARLHVPDGAPISRDPLVRSATLEFVRRVVEHVRETDVVQAWQVENEPLDVAGPNHWSIEPDFLAEEVALVRALDPRARPIVVNAFVETQPLAQLPKSRDAMVARARAALAVADVLGLDVYPGRTVRVFDHEFSVRWPSWLWSGVLSQLRTLAVQQGKEAWIVEGQAEPWISKGKSPPAAWPGAIVEPASVTSTVSHFGRLGYTTVLLWGAEHWEDQRNDRNDAWWSAMRPLFTSPAQPPSANHELRVD
jgi:hypothetical protein